MDVRQALERRVSIRAFRPDPVSRETVVDILSTARRAPSGGNFQPWRVFVLAGSELARFTDIVVQRFEAGIAEPPEYQFYPKGVGEPYRTRRREAGDTRYAAMGSKTPTPEILRELQLRNCRFFGAPVGLIFCIDRRLDRAQWADMGIYLQSVMLLAADHGLDTCPQGFWTNWHETIAAFFSLPPELMVYCGMSLGYRDPADPLCVTSTARADLAEFAEIRGF